MSSARTVLLAALAGIAVGGVAAGPLGALLFGAAAAWIGWAVSRQPAARHPAPHSSAVTGAGPTLASSRPPTTRTGELAAIADYLEDAVRRGLVDLDTYARLQRDIGARQLAGSAPATAVRPAAPRPVVLPAPPPASAAPPPPRRAAAPQTPLRFRPAQAPPARPAPVPAGPSAWQRALRAAWEALVSDVAVHGLAYLGVLFVFVATFGFVVFAFSGVGSAWRPVAEVAIPTVLFGAARFLRTRGAPFVSASLELLAGAVTPVVLFAAFADGAPFPPDLERGGLVGVLTAVALALAATYAGVAARRPASPLRYLVAPMVWLAAGVLGLMFEEGPSAEGMALVAAAVVTTTVLAANQPRHLLARASVTVAVPGMALAYALLLLLAGATGWPAAPLLVGGAMVITLLEVLGERVPFRWAGQGLAVAATAATLAPSFGGAPVAAGATTAYVALAELWLNRRSRYPASLLLLGAAGAATALTVAEPVPMLVASLIGTLWSVARLTLPTPPLVQRAAAAGLAVLPGAAALAVGRLTSAGPALLMVAAAAAVGAAVIRVVPRGERYLAWWAGCYGAVALIGTVPAQPIEPAAWLAGAAALGTAALVAAVPALAARIWLAAAGGSWTLLLGAWAVGFPAEWIPAGFAAVALAAVLAAGAASHGPRDAGAAHAALAAHLAATVAFAWPAPDRARLVALALWTAGWLFETVAAEVRPSPLRHLLAVGVAPRVPERWAGALAPTLAAAGLPATVAMAADLSGLVAGQRGRMSLALAALALGYALTARAMEARRPLAPVAATASFFLAAVAVAVAAPEPWPSIASISVALGVVTVISAGLRRAYMTWTSWALSAVLVLLLANRAGVAPAHLHYVLAAWGALAMLLALSADHAAAGRRGPGQGFRLAWARAAFALGAVAVPVALSYVMAAAPAGGWWPWLGGAAALYLVVALLLPAGSVSAVAYGLAALAAGGALTAAGRSPVSEPVLLLPIAAALVVVAAAAEWLTPERDPWLRWDLPPLAVAHLVAAVAMAAALDAGQVAAVYAGSGGLAFVVAIVKRRPAWALAGEVALLVGAAAAGPGWLALALAASSLAALSASFLVAGVAADALGWAAAGFAGAAWVAATVWGAWWPDPVVAITASASGGLALAAAGALRAFPRAWQRLAPWGTLAGVALLVAGVAAPAGSMEPRASGLALAAGLALWAVALGLAARPLEVPGLRHGAVLAAAAAGWALGWAWQVTATDVVGAALSAGLLLTVIGLALWALRASVWAGPAALGAALANTVGVVAATGGLPDTTLLAIALAAAGAQAIAAGVVTRTATFFYVGLPTLLGAWLAFAADALAGDPNWFTVPIGLTVIATVDVARGDRRRRGLDPAPAEVVLADVAGMALLTGAALVEIVTSSIGYGAVAMIAGTVLTAYGVATRVRRRCYFGAGVAALAALLMVTVPLVEIVPRFRGVALWAVVAAIGAALIVTATYLEQGKTKVQAGIRRLEELMGGWE